MNFSFRFIFPMFRVVLGLYPRLLTRRPLSPCPRRSAQARALAARMRLEAVTTSAPAVAIQAAARRYLAKRRRNRLVKEKQIEWELSTMANEMSRFCAERARLR